MYNRNTLYCRLGFITFRVLWPVVVHVDSNRHINQIIICMKIIKDIDKMYEVIMIISMHVIRNYSGYGLSQWETMLHCSNVSHWLSPYLGGSLVMYELVGSNIMHVLETIYTLLLVLFLGNTNIYFHFISSLDSWYGVGTWKIHPCGPTFKTNLRVSECIYG